MKKRIISLALIITFVLSASFYVGTFALAETDYSGKIVKVNGSTGLYYVTANKTRYVFPNEKTYKTWFPDFSDVITLEPEDFMGIKLVGNVVYRPGVLLVKIQTDPKIYAVSRNGVLRWVKTEALARALYGDKWNLLVDDVPDSFFVNYIVGTAISQISDYDADDEVEGTDTIEANHGLALGHAKRARTGRCHMISDHASITSVYARRCIMSDDNNNNDDGNNNDDDDDNNDDDSSDGNPYISEIKVSDGGEVGYIDVDDTIEITFNEAVDPESINDDLEEGDYVNDVVSSETGGVTVSSSGKVTIKNIASFDMGSVDFSETFTVKLALSSNGKVLTITLTSGSDVEIINEDFEDTRQTGGTIVDVDDNKMQSDSNISNPSGTFGGDISSNPTITEIEVFNGGEDGYIDVDDRIVITFSEAIDPESINDDLEEGDNVRDIQYSQTGGVRVSSSGKVTIKDIAAFDMGAVDFSETFIVKLALSSSGKTLTITLTSGSDVEIINEDFDDASQTGGTIKDLAGDEMESDSRIEDPTGSFGGNIYNSSGDPYIVEIEVSNGGEEGFIDDDDTIEITFNESIDPESIHNNLVANSYVNNVAYSATGGVRVSSSGVVTINDIASFDMGSVDYSENFNVKLALSYNGKTLTITLTSGSDVEITNEDFDESFSQLSGTVEDVDGNTMQSDSDSGDLDGTFGGNYDGYNDSGSDPYIATIEVTNGGEDGYVDTGDQIIITFNEAIEPESINGSLDNDDSVTGISYSETGGVRVSSSGMVTINNIASFDIGSVEESETFTVSLALNSNGRVLTITLTSGSDVEITDEDFDDAAQTGGTIEDEDGNEMNSDSSISDPTGTFGGRLYNNNDDSNAPRIRDIEISNGGDSGYIDAGDTIEVTFNEAIDPESINTNLEAGSYVTNVLYTMTGGINVFPGGALVIEGISIFDVGSVASSGFFTVNLALSSDSEVLTITLISGSDIRITTVDIDGTSQTGGSVEDEAGNEMQSDVSIGDASGSF